MSSTTFLKTIIRERAIITGFYEEYRKAIPNVGRFPDIKPLNHLWPLQQGFYRRIPRPTSYPYYGLIPLRKAKYVCLSCWEQTRNSGQVKYGRPACDWKFGPYINLVKKERLGIALKSGISNRWLYQPCFGMAIRTAEAHRVVYEAGIFYCQNPKCKRPLGRNKKKNERPAERPRPGISDCWLCINCFRKRRRGTLSVPALST
ncbi:hypothetical protein V2W45_1467032 [Cenococcum geophilum]